MKRGLGKLERRYKRTKLAIDRDIYNIKSLEYDHLMNTTKENYYMNKVYDCLKDQGSMFAIINKLLHCSSSSLLPACDDSTSLAKNFTDFLRVRYSKYMLSYLKEAHLYWISILFLSLRLQHC